MRKIFKLSLFEYKRKWNKPVLVLLYIFTPIIITLIMWFAFGGGSSGGNFAPIKIAIVNNDKEGIISKFFVNALSDEKLKDKIITKVVNIEESENLINNRKVSAILIIPENFSHDLIEMKKTHILLIKNPAQMIYPSIVEIGMNIVKDITNFMLTLFENEINMIKKSMDKGEKISNNDLIKLYEKSRVKIRKLIEIFNDRGIGIKEIKTKKKGGSYVIYIFSGMGFFFLFFISNAFLEDMVKDRKKFVLKRLFLSELKKSEYYFSKLLSAVIFLLTIELVLSLSGRIIFSIKTNNIFLLSIMLLVSSLMLSLISIFVVGISKNHNQVHNINMIIVFLFAILGGSLIPVSSLPSSVRMFSVISPLYYITQGINSLISGNLNEFYNDLLISSLIVLFLLFISYFVNIKALKRVIK